MKRSGSPGRPTSFGSANGEASGGESDSKPRCLDAALKLSAMAAANVVGPCVAKKLEADGFAVSTCSGADTAAWRQATHVEKSHTVDAATDA